MKPFSVYKPDVCCAHSWVRSGPIENEYECFSCHATCKRDETGQIEAYSLNHLHSDGFRFDTGSYNVRNDPKRYMRKRDYPFTGIGS